MALPRPDSRRESIGYLSSMSEGLTPLAKPPNPKGRGLYSPTKSTVHLDGHLSSMPTAQQQTLTRSPPNASQDGVPFHRLGDNAAGALPAMLTMVTDPALPKHLTPETAVPLLAVPRVLGVALTLLDVERMGRRPHANDWTPGLDVIGNVS